MPRKDAEPQEETTEEEQEQEYEEQPGTSINITEESITIDVPRDGNEGETLSRIAKLVDGLAA